MTTKQRTNQESTQTERRVAQQQYHLCPSCGNFASFEEGQKYCMVCGTILIGSCPGCSGPIIYPTAHYCSVCGTPLVEAKIPKAK